MDKKKNEVVINESARQKLVARFQSVNEMVYNNFKRDTWKLAHAALLVTKDKTYNKAFKNDKDFASAVGYTAGALSKLITSAKIDNEYQIADTYNLTTGQAQELIPLFRYKLDDGTDALKTFLDRHAAEGDLKNTSTKLLREYVQDELYLLAAGNSEKPSEGTTDGNSEKPSEGTTDDVPMAAHEVLDVIAGVVQQCISKIDIVDADVYTEITCAAFNAISEILRQEGLL